MFQGKTGADTEVFLPSVFPVPDVTIDEKLQVTQVISPELVDFNRLSENDWPGWGFIRVCLVMSTFGLEIICNRKS